MLGLKVSESLDESDIEASHPDAGNKGEWILDEFGVEASHLMLWQVSESWIILE